MQLGIEDLNSLGSANLVDLVLQARVPVGRLVDWVDQTILYLHLEPAAVMGEPSARERLRKLGIRTATELEAALRSPAAGEAVTPENMRFALGMSTEAIRSILAVFAADPQLEHVRSWRRDG